MPQGEVKAYESCDILDGEPCIPCQQCIKLEAQIVAAKGPVLDNLLILKRNLRTEINRHHDPIGRRLPPELTSRVFEIYGEENEEIYSEENEIYSEENEEIYSEENEACGDWKTPPYRPFSPLLLGAVCQTWRRIAWSSPSLWTRVHIYFRESMDESYVDQVEEWLQRSGRLPLSMLVEFSSSNISARFRRLISIINQHSNHWQNLYITCYHKQFRLICGDSRGAPILRNLCIERLDSGHWENYTIKPTMNGMKLRPSRVQLKNLLFKSVDIHWSDITDVELLEDSIHLDECIKLLQQAPQLINCHIEDICTPISADWKAFIPPYQLIVPHGLQSLFLKGYQEEDIGAFFQSFTFPNLSHLHLDDIDDYISLWSSIISLTNRSSMCLTSLEINNIACDSETLIQILQHLPCLVDLDICASPNALLQVHHLLSALANAFFMDTSGHYQTLFLPKLQSIRCLYCDSDPWDSSFWKSISQLFGPWKDGKPSTGIRPLRSVSVEGFDAYWLPQGSSAPRICTDRNILLHLVELSRIGTRFELCDNTVDLLKFSMRHHGITE